MPGPAATALPRDELLRLVEVIGHYFVVHRMQDHVRLAGEFYRATRDGKTPREDRVGTAWSAQLVVEWCQVLRVPPYDADIDVHPRGWRCPCSTEGFGEWTVTTFPDGHVAACGRCKARWLVLS